MDTKKVILGLTALFGVASGACTKSLSEGQSQEAAQIAQRENLPADDVKALPNGHVQVKTDGGWVEYKTKSLTDTPVLVRK
jgi:hypothetical protein